MNSRSGDVRLVFINNPQNPESPRRIPGWGMLDGFLSTTRKIQRGPEKFQVGGYKMGSYQQPGKFREVQINSGLGDVRWVFINNPENPERSRKIPGLGMLDELFLTTQKIQRGPDEFQV